MRPGAALVLFTPPVVYAVVALNDLLNFFWARSRAKARAGGDRALTEQYYDKQNV